MANNGNDLENRLWAAADSLWANIRAPLDGHCFEPTIQLPEQQLHNDDDVSEQNEVSHIPEANGQHCCERLRRFPLVDHVANIGSGFEQMACSPHFPLIQQSTQ